MHDKGILSYTHCPRCKTILRNDTISEFNVSVEVDICNSCGGIWFDKGELSKIDKVVEATLFEVHKIPTKSAQKISLHCPSCNNFQLMQKAEHNRDRKVIIDYCPKCQGIWLDKGEFQAIQKENLFKIIGKFFKWILLMN